MINEGALVASVAAGVVLLGAGSVAYRRVGRPITHLIRAVRAAAANRTPEGNTTGRRELSTLVDDFNRLIDVTEAELDASSRLTALVESSGDAIIGKTLDGTVTSWNAAAAKLFGYAAADIIGRNISDIVPADRAAEEALILRRVKNGENVEQLETSRIRKDGTEVNVSITVSSIRDRAGVIVGLSTVSRDITERNRAEADRRALTERLVQSERMESVGQLAGGIAHDFNNLLAVIINYASFVLAETEGQPAVHADVEQIQLAAQRGARLTKQLLTFARRDTITTEALDLNMIVADVHNLLKRTIGEHIDLVMSLADNALTINSDRGQIEQILLNLAVNARDAMRDGGTLTIETSRAEIDDAYVELHPDAVPGRYIQLVVSDTGHGMAPEVASRIFEPFFTTKMRGDGTGLGLATVYGIVTNAGGTINVYSEPGLGSTFRLYFPAVDQPSDVTSSATNSALAIAAQGAGETILVVEDEPAVLELTSRILRDNGYAVLTAANFQEALEIATAHDFDLLLTDSVMPIMSGRILAQHVDDLRPGRPALFMSGYSAGVVLPRGVVDHDAAFIQKPFDRQTLLRAVHTVLATHRRN